MGRHTHLQGLRKCINKSSRMQSADSLFDERENIRGADNTEAHGRKEAAGEGMVHGSTHAPGKE